MTTYRLGSATIHHGEGQTVTVLSDGRETRANWMVQDGQAATAEQYGIPLDRLNRDHDLAHAILAAVLGLPESPTLAGVASGHYWPAWFREEAAVLAFCGYAAAAGVGHGAGGGPSGGWSWIPDEHPGRSERRYEIGPHLFGVC